jgi:hypothetical protein
MSAEDEDVKPNNEGSEPITIRVRDQVSLLGASLNVSAVGMFGVCGLCRDNLLSLLVGTFNSLMKKDFFLSQCPDHVPTNLK